MRCIDADALEKEGWSLHRTIQVDKNTMEYQTKPLKQVPTIEPQPQWIPCSERLPDKDGDYIVTFEKGYASDYGLDPIGIAPFEVDCEGFGFWQEQFDMHTLGSLGSDWVDINVIAWMPLPECYQEDI